MPYAGHMSLTVCVSLCLYAFIDFEEKDDSVAVMEALSLENDGEQHAGKHRSLAFLFSSA